MFFPQSQDEGTMDDLRQAHVRKLHPALVRQQQVLGLQVAEHDPGEGGLWCIPASDARVNIYTHIKWYKGISIYLCIYIYIYIYMCVIYIIYIYT